MKRISLLSLKDPAAPDDPGHTVDYRNLIDQAMKIPLDRQGGATIDEMRRSIRVLDALDAANGTLELEDADYELLKRKVEGLPWAVIDRRFVQFYDDVTGA